MSKRVLVLNHFAVPPGNPGGTRHAELFSRISGWSHLVVASRRNALTGDEQAPAPGFRLVDVTGHSDNGLRRVRGWVDYAIAATIRGLMCRRPHLVYASSPHLLAGVAGLVVATLRRAPMVLEVRDPWPEVLIEMGRLRRESLLCRILQWIEVTLYRRSAAVVILAEGSRARVEETSPGTPVVFVPNGADPDAWGTDEPRDVLRRKLGFTSFTAVYVGAHGPANGLETLVDAAARLAEHDVDIVLFGGGVSKKGLEDAVAERGITNMRFVDPIPKSAVPEVLAAADIGLHTLADVEIFAKAVSPNKIFDYMAAGLPVVTNAPGLSAELIESSGCGWTTGPADVSEGILLALATSRSEREDRGRHGTEWLRAHRSHESLALKLRDLFEGLSDSRRFSRSR